MKKNALKLILSTLALVCFFCCQNAYAFDLNTNGSFTATHTHISHYYAGSSGSVVTNLTVGNTYNLNILFPNAYNLGCGNPMTCSASTFYTNLYGTTTDQIALVSFNSSPDEVGHSTTTSQYQGSGVWTPFFVNTSTHFNSISFATSTALVTVTGYWNYNTTSSLNNSLQITQSDNFSTQTLYSISATSSGPFSFSTNYIDSSQIIGSASTTYTLNPQITFTGILSKLGTNPFNGTGEILDTISTTTTSTSTTTIYGEINQNPFTNATYGTSTIPNATDLLSFLNVPTLLQTKIPFAYFFQIASGIKDGITSSSTTAIPTGNFIWKGINGTSTIDMFSTTTIGYYLSPTIINAWRTLLLVVLIIEFGYNVYNRAKHHSLI